jgi:hypothetical protein
MNRQNSPTRGGVALHVISHFRFNNFVYEPPGKQAAEELAEKDEYKKTNLLHGNRIQNN